MEVDTHTDAKYCDLINGFGLNILCYGEKFEGFYVLILSHLIKSYMGSRDATGTRKGKKTPKDPMPRYSR
jgi:hypothetical protein